MPISEVSRQNFLNQKSVYDYDREFQKDQANALAMQGERQAQQNALAQQGRLDAQEGRLDAEAGRKQATFDADAYQNKQKGVLSKIPLVRDPGSMRNWLQEAVVVDIVDANQAGQIFQDISSRPEALNEWLQKFDQLGVKAETRYTQGAQDARSAATSAAAMERTAAQNASRERQAALARENARTIASMPARAAASDSKPQGIGDSGLVGIALLESMSPEDRTVVEGLIEGTVSSDQISTTNNRRERMVAAAIRVDPDAVIIGTKLGSRERAQVFRVLAASEQALADVKNISKLKLSSSTGLFGGRTQGPGLFAATKEVLAQVSTPQEDQIYAKIALGAKRALATIEAFGQVPTESLTSQMDPVLWKKGETHLSKLHGLAGLRQAVEVGLSVIRDYPGMDKVNREKVEKDLLNLQEAVPFTHADLIDLEATQQINPKSTLEDVLKAKKESARESPAVAAARAKYEVRK